MRAAADALPGFREFRAIGPAGISNLLLFRVDSLPQSREAEPNDDPTQANPLAIPSAVAGVLLPQDLDWFSFQGRAGQGVTIEVEARRLGSAIVPQARLLGPSGSIAGPEPADARRRGRLPAVVHPSRRRRYSVEVRDALYRGSAAARYRLRIDTGPFATGLFPLGGRRGETLTVTASGGNLTRALAQDRHPAGRAGRDRRAGSLRGTWRDAARPRPAHRRWRPEIERVTRRVGACAPPQSPRVSRSVRRSTAGSTGRARSIATR